jgi:ubiquinone/menaquinone biosynthesis C-methylase UbiE
MEHNETIRKEFSKQAARFGDPGLTLSNLEYLAWALDFLPLRPHFRVLDIATGTGHLSRAIAPRVRQVVAMDMTPEMLEEAKKGAARAGLNNILFDEGDAAALNYNDSSFDMVVSRLAIHHFPKPGLQIREMVRVLKPDHTLGIIDLLSPSDEALIAPYNRLERLRDPSHTVALTKEQLIKIMEVSGLLVSGIDTRDVEVNFESWVGMTGVDRPTIDVIRRELESDIAGGHSTGMRPYKKDGSLYFLQMWSIVIAAKHSNE